MASGTISGYTGNEYIDAKIVWSSSPTTATNKSSVTAALYYKRNNTGFTTQGTGTFSITINGVKTSATKSLTITESEWVKAVEATTSVTHNSDGTKSIVISASGSMSGTSLVSTTVSDTVSLDTIPRASAISSVSNITLGKACNVKWTPFATSFRYKIKFTLGTWSYTTDAIHPNSTSAYSYTGYTIPLEVANQLPNEKTGAVTATLYTYSNSAATTLVGSASSKTFTVTVPNNTTTQPTATMTLSPVTSLSSPFDKLYIKGRTKVDANFSNGEGKYGAEVVSYSLSVGGKSYGSPYTSDYLSTTGSITVKGTVKDSRGYSRTYTQTITVIDYNSPTILPASGEKGIICARCDKDGNLSESGTYLKIKAKRSYSKVMTGTTQNNFCSIRYRWREESSNTFSAWETILGKTTLASDTADTQPLSGVVSSTETAYVIQVGVIDDIGKTDVVQFIVPTAFVTIDIPEKHKGRRIGIGRYVEDTDEDGVYIDLPIHGEIADYVTETGVAYVDPNDSNKGYWRYRKWKSGALDMNAALKVSPVTDTAQGTDKGYWSQQIEVALPFAVTNFNFTGTSAAYFMFFANATMEGNNKIRFRLFRFQDFANLADKDVYVRIIASGKYV
jgi:hypothetical protein